MPELDSKQQQKAVGRPTRKETVIEWDRPRTVGLGRKEFLWRTFVTYSLLNITDIGVFSLAWTFIVCDDCCPETLMGTQLFSGQYGK